MVGTIQNSFVMALLVLSMIVCCQLSLGLIIGVLLLANVCLLLKTYMHIVHVHVYDNILKHLQTSQPDTNTHRVMCDSVILRPCDM